jgi:membrane-bound lytic murein transglycosylase B
MKGSALMITKHLLGYLTLLLFLLINPSITPAQGQQNFNAWLAELRSEALSSGISKETLDSALSRVQLLPRVTDLEQRQPEFRLTVEEYLQRVVPESRVLRGREAMKENRDLLNRVYRDYGVQPSVLVALWGIETDFGRSVGAYPVIDATATLAFQGRRTAFFRQELFHALRIIDQGHITPEEMIGSWAGAMGQVQFMPSSFHNYAVDYDGNGRRDIWTSLPDVFASAANYLSKAGWMKDEPWGLEATIPANFSPSSAGLEVRKSLAEWKGAGVRYKEKNAPQAEPSLLWSVVAPDRQKSSAYLVNNNYRALLRWNRSHHFAIAVGTLSDRIAAQ